MARDHVATAPTATLPGRGGGGRSLTRRGLLRGLGFVGGGAVAGGLYASWIEPVMRLVVAEHRVTPQGWPDGLRLTVAVLTDFHVAEPFMPLSRLDDIVAATNALRPDMIVTLGDYAGSGRMARGRVPVREIAEVLRGLRAPGGVHAILGNHDWWDDPQVQRTRGGIPESYGILAEAGIGVLHNAAVKAGAVWIAGLGSLWAFRQGAGFLGTGNIARALGAVTDDDPLILLAHEPDIFPRVPARVSLTLSGHTHGGQVRAFGYSPVVPSRYGNRYAYGHVVEAGRHIVVSGGLGLSIAPVRFGVPPEITLVHLG